MNSKVVLLFSSLFIFLKGNAQSDINVEVIIQQLHHSDLRSFLQKSTDAVFKFYHDTSLTTNCLTDKCLTIATKDGEKTLDTTNWPELKTKFRLKTFKQNSSSGLIRIKMIAYENDKGEIDEYDNGDDGDDVRPLEISLNNLSPGVFSENLKLISEKQKFYAIIKLRYSLPKPANIVMVNEEIISDATQNITLQSAIGLKNKNGLIYQWEYRTEQSDAWYQLGKPTNTETIIFNAARDIFEKPITKNQRVELRIKAVSSEVSSQYSDFFTLWFTPMAPSLTDKKPIINPTCPNKNSGSINIKSFVSPTDSIRFYVIKGHAIQFESFPDNIQNVNNLTSGTIGKNDSLKIENLNEGEYSIVLYNPFKPVGKIFLAHSFNITKYTTLMIKSVDVVNSGCDANDGQIALKAEGGNPAKLTYYIDPPLGIREIDDNNHKVIFSQLPAGIYSVVVKDECTQDVTTKDIHILKVSPSLTGEIAIGSQPNNEAADGSLKIQINGGSGAYSYYLSADNFEVKKDEVKASWIVDHLPKGNFKIKIIDNNNRCSLWDTTFSLGGENIVALTNKSITSSETRYVVNAGVAGVATQSSTTDSLRLMSSNKQETIPITNTAAQVSNTTNIATSTIENSPLLQTPGVNDSIVIPSGFTKKKDTYEIPESPQPVYDSSIIIDGSFTKTDKKLDFYNKPERRCKSYSGYTNEKDFYVVIIEKSKYRLTILNSKNDTVITYPVVFGNKDQGCKMMKDDRRTPEGEYEISEKREHKDWDKIMFINYPNDVDKKRFIDNKKKGLIPAEAKIGDQIAIHGTIAGADYEIDLENDWTNGCIATKNKYIGQIYRYIEVGTKVIIKK